MPIGVHRQFMFVLARPVGKLAGAAPGGRGLTVDELVETDPSLRLWVEKTLTDEEANQVRDRIMEALRDELGAVQR